MSTITVSYDQESDEYNPTAPAQSPSKKTSRATKKAGGASNPTTQRITRSLASQETSAQLVTQNDEEDNGNNNDDDDNDDDDGEGAGLQTLTKLVKELRTTLRETRAEVAQMRKEQIILTTQNNELQDEIRTLRNQVSALSESLPSTQSWASVVAYGRSSPSTTQPMPGLSRTSSSTRANKEANCLRISTRGRKENEQNDNTFTRYLETDIANRHIREALHKTETTKEVEVIGVGTTKTGYIIRFKNQNSTEIARANAEWLQELGNETKLVKHRYGVVAHRFPTTGITLPENKQEAINKIMEENEWQAKNFNVDDTAWLKQSDKPLGVTASLGIWFDTPEAAEWAVANGVVRNQRYIGSVELYQVKRKRCHRCQNFGHLAWSCKETMRCRHCSGEHDRRESRDCRPGTDAKCVDCGGPHNTGARVCPGPIIPRPNR